MTRSYVTAAEARNMPGLRIAFSAGMPGPWGEAVRCFFDIKKIDYVPVIQEIGEPNDVLKQWTGQSSAPVAMLDEVLDVVDYILVMSVNPGFGGQRLIPHALEKVRQLVQRKRERGLQFPIEIDGGVNHENVADVIHAGVEWVAAGSSIFHSVNPVAAFEEMRERAYAAGVVRV